MTRAQAEQELRDLAEGWEHLGDEPRRAEALAALDDLADGATVVTAGHTVFVTHDPPG